MTDEIQNGAELLDTDYVAWNILGCTANWLERMRCQGRGPAYIKIGRAVRYRRSAIDAWLAENTRIPEEEARRTPSSRRGRRKPKTAALSQPTEALSLA
jgi:predicted DNA-binding transcriptional regulator AlpA